MDTPGFRSLPQRLLSINAQRVVNGLQIIFPMGDKVLHDEVPLTGCRESVLRGPQELLRLLQIQLESYGQNKDRALLRMVGRIVPDLAEELSVHAGTLVDLDIREALLPDQREELVVKVLPDVIKKKVQIDQADLAGFITCLTGPVDRVSIFTGSGIHGITSYAFEYTSAKKTFGHRGGDIFGGSRAHEQRPREYVQVSADVAGKATRPDATCAIFKSNTEEHFFEERTIEKSTDYKGI